jgi:DNA-binding NtrC family response regulator
LSAEKRPNKESSEKVRESDLHVAELRAALGVQGKTKVSKWTGKKLLEHGLSHAGITLWEWDIKTGEVWIHSAPQGHPCCYDFPSPTNWNEIVHKEDHIRFTEALKVFEQTSWSWLDCYFRLATKAPRWVHARNIRLSADSNEALPRVRGLFFDSTESELAKNMLFWDRKAPRSSNESTTLRLRIELERHGKDAKKIKSLRTQCDRQFDCLFNYSNLPAFEKNASLRTIRINDAMSQLLGIAPLDVLKHTDHELWGEEANAHLQKLCGYALRGESVLATSERCIKGVNMSFIDHLFPSWNSIGFIDGIHCVMAPLPTWTSNSAYTDSERNRMSPAMEAVLAQVQLVAQHNCYVLLSGESGTGKDHFARQIHDLSQRSDDGFENFNCAALQKDLAGSELFGHEAGAFTGAKTRRKGIFELAGKGTLLLNEIGDMPLDLQSQLLTILEIKSFRRVGGERNLSLDARIIAATNVDLNTGVEEGRFRKDLYHRLTVFTIRVPPLRERLGELPGLVEKLAQKIAADMGIETVPKLDPLAMQKLSEYSWPGNIRELRNVLERATIHAHGPVIGADHIIFEPESIPDYERKTAKDAALGGTRMSRKHHPQDFGGEPVSRPAARSKKPTPEGVRKLYEHYILGEGWSRERLAKHLGTDSSTVKKWFKEAELPAGKAGRPRKKSAE